VKYKTLAVSHSFNVLDIPETTVFERLTSHAVIVVLFHFTDLSDTGMYVFSVGLYNCVTAKVTVNPVVRKCI
jgi:hypothetical protein